MFKKIFIIVFLVAIISISINAWRTRDDMTNEKLIALSKTDPKAFNQYVQSQINALPTTIDVKSSISDTVAKKPTTAAELLKASETDPYAMQKFLNGNVDVDERTEADKLINFFLRGKYE